MISCPHGSLSPSSARTAPCARRPGTKHSTRVATGLTSTIDAHGPDAVGFFACSKSTNEANYLAQKLVRQAIGTNNIDSCNRT